VYGGPAVLRVRAHLDDDAAEEVTLHPAILPAQQKTARRRLVSLFSFRFELPPLHRAILNRLAFLRRQKSSQFFNLPNIIGEAHCHRWRHPERLVNTAEVLLHEVNGYDM
jgi:hypothetical protein